LIHIENIGKMMAILYDFQCQNCNKITEKLFKLNEVPQKVICQYCGGQAKKVFVPGHGGVRLDADVPWLASACQTLQRQGERPIETRGEYNRYLKEHNLACKG
jgi:putative FmdB family regulatory protein